MNNTIRIAAIYGKLHERICRKLEKADGKGIFLEYPWKNEIGSGTTCVMNAGNIIEKAGANFSQVSGLFSPSMENITGEHAGTYHATGISSIIHAKNPFVPTIHMNVRYFALDNGVEWFGGGIDLTPAYIDTSQVKNFHLKIKSICDRYNKDFYPDFKAQADEYFFLDHRNETRGVGGIFFDKQRPDKELNIDQWISFTSELAEFFPEIYSDFMQKNALKFYSETNKKWQKIRRGRYVEFNLIYDRGTRFGLENSGNTESILISLPPEVNWEFNHIPQKDSEEEKTLGLFRKGIDWINYPE